MFIPSISNNRSGTNKHDKHASSNPTTTTSVTSSTMSVWESSLTTNNGPITAFGGIAAYPGSPTFYSTAPHSHGSTVSSLSSSSSSTFSPMTVAPSSSMPGHVNTGCLSTSESPRDFLSPSLLHDFSHFSFCANQHDCSSSSLQVPQPDTSTPTLTNSSSTWHGQSLPPLASSWSSTDNDTNVPPTWSATEARSDRMLAATSYHFYHSSSMCRPQAVAVSRRTGASSRAHSSSQTSSSSAPSTSSSNNGSTRTQTHRRIMDDDTGDDATMMDDDTIDRQLSAQFADQNSMNTSRRVIEEDEWEDEWGSELNFMVRQFEFGEQRPSYIL